MDSKQRIERFEQTRRELEAEGWRGEPHTISVLKANLMAFVTAGPVAALCVALFFLVRKTGEGSFSPAVMWIFFGAIIASIFVHEGLHGLVWGAFCKNRWKSVYIGMMWKQLTPFCCCMEPLPFGAYLAGGLAPFAVLGLGSFAAAMATGNLFVLLVSVVNVLAAGGDTTIALMLLRHRRARIIDHPTECGFWAFYPPQA